MKQTINIKNIFILALLMTLLYPFNFVNAVAAKEIPYTPSIGNAIQQNCANLKNTLTDLRKRDISSRVAHVYIYDFLLVRTNAFATRLSNNKLNNTLVTNDNTNLQNSLNQFKTDYNNYDDELSKLITTNCSQTDQFYQALQTTRASRQKLAQDITTLNKNWQQLTKDINNVDLNRNGIN